MSFLGELISRLLDNGPEDEKEITHAKFVSSIVDTLRSDKSSNDDILEALRDLGAVVYIGIHTLFIYLFVCLFFVLLLSTSFLKHNRVADWLFKPVLAKKADH